MAHAGASLDQAPRVSVTAGSGWGGSRTLGRCPEASPFGRRITTFPAGCGPGSCARGAVARTLRWRTRTPARFDRVPQDATLRVLDRLSSADVGHELATVSPAAPALVAFCDAVVAQQQAMDALLSHHSVPLDSPALVPASLARHVISTAAESASPSSTVSLGFRHRDASRADSGAEMASSSASQSAHEPPHPHQPSRLAQSWPRVDASGAAWSRGEEDGEGREHGEVGPERGGEDRERDPFRELEGMLGHSRARELLEAAVERYAEQRLETIVRAVMSKAAAEGAAPATTGAAQTVVADGAGGEPAAALAQGAPPTTTLPAAQDGAAANLAPGSQRVTTAPAHDNEDEDFSSLPDSPRSAVSSARGQPPALTPNPVFESAAADVATTHAEAPGPSTAAPAGAQDAAAQPSQPDAQASPQQDPAAAAPAPAAPQAGSPPDVTTPAHAESARPSPGPPSGQASAQAPIRSAFSLTATPRKESKSPVAAAAEDGPAAAARPPEESPSEPRPEAMHDVAAAELEAMLVREGSPGAGDGELTSLFTWGCAMGVVRARETPSVAGRSASHVWGHVLCLMLSLRLRVRRGR